MDPFGIVALVVGAGWLIGKLNEKKSEQPRNKTELKHKLMATEAPSPLHMPNLDHVIIALKPKKPVHSEEKIEILPEYKLVRNLVLAGFPITFVTGGAGTGKSTFVHWLTDEFDGNVLIAAPTGIAALNNNGKTLHSLCKMPAAWIVKENIQHFKPEIAQ